MKLLFSYGRILNMALTVSAIALLLSSTTLAATAAFPGAAGFGATTPGGRGGRIIEVTNLNDSGSGSFRAACEASGARIVIFRTGGTIRISQNIKIRNPFITIAGQTAPGDGICIRGAGLGIETHDVIVRGIRIRVGDAASGPSPDNRDGLVMDNDSPMYDVVVDHCSISWAIDENLSIWHPNAHSITVSHSIISEALYDSLHSKGPHSMGPIVGPGNSRISFIGNLLAHNNARNPRLKGTQVEVINNLIYDRGTKDVDIGGGSGPQEISIVGNYFLKGPSYTSNSYPVFLRSDVPSGSKVFVDDNVYNTYTSGSIYNTSSHIVTSPLGWSSGAVAQKGSETFDWVLANVGANPTDPDPVDARIVSEVRNRSGSIIDSPSQVGGWPNMAEGTPPTDSDHDGMPNAWETVRGLNPNNANDAGADRNGDGYTNVEEYINSLLDGDTGNITQVYAPENLRVIN
jgi:pectate lyase